jgi:predicted GIY-YIG superfamily endonuclease
MKKQISQKSNGQNPLINIPAFEDSYIYKISNDDDTLNYYGSTYNLKTRKANHKQEEHLKKILKGKNCKYTIMETLNCSKRDLLNKEQEYIKNNKCINKYKPITVYKDSQHKASLRWGRRYTHCEICDKGITQWNLAKHQKTKTHIEKEAEANPDNIIIGGQMTYQRAVKIYNEREKLMKIDHKYERVKKGTDAYYIVMDILAEEG